MTHGRPIGGGASEIPANENGHAVADYCFRHERVGNGNEPCLLHMDEVCCTART